MAIQSMWFLFTNVQCLKEQSYFRGAEQNGVIRLARGEPNAYALAEIAYVRQLTYNPGAPRAGRCVAAAAEWRSEATCGIESLEAASSLWWLAACHLAVWAA